MPDAPITEVQVAVLLRQSLLIEDTVNWMPKGDQAYVEATLRVRHGMRGVGLEVKLTANRHDTTKYSFILLMNGNLKLAAWDIGGSHQNKHTDGSKWIRQAHEHRWTDRCHGSWACSIHSLPDGMQEAFLAFCRAFGVDFRGEWLDPPAPPMKGLWDR